jgi:hypothetical protein
MMREIKQTKTFKLSEHAVNKPYNDTVASPVSDASKEVGLGVNQEKAKYMLCHVGRR